MHIVDIDALMKILEEKGISIPILAKSLNMDKTTLYRKLKNNGESLTIKDIHNICDCLELSSEQAMMLFFKHTVA